MEFNIGYSEFLTFTVGVFAKRTSSIKPSVVNGITDVEFINTYKSYKSRGHRAGGLGDEVETLREDCRAKISYFAEKFVELVTVQIRGSKFSQLDSLQRIMKNLLKRKSMSMLEAVMSANPDAWFTLLMINEPNHSDYDEFNKLLLAWRDLEDVGTGLGQEDSIDIFVKEILQNKKLNEEICRLVIFLTTKNVT